MARGPGRLPSTPVLQHPSQMCQRGGRHWSTAGTASSTRTLRDPRGQTARRSRRSVHPDPVDTRALRRGLRPTRCRPAEGPSALVGIARCGRGVTSRCRRAEVVRHPGRVARSGQGRTERTQSCRLSAYRALGDAARVTGGACSGHRDAARRPWKPLTRVGHAAQVLAQIGSSAARGPRWRKYRHIQECLRGARGLLPTSLGYIDSRSRRAR